MFLKINLKDLGKIIEENTLIYSTLLILIIFFSDLSSLNINFKINLLQFFFLSNFFVEFSFFDKSFFLKSNIYNISIFLPLLFQLYIFLILFKNSEKKYKIFFYLIFISSLIYFFFNLISYNNNFLTFDKLWIAFLLRHYLKNLLIIKLNRILLSISLLSIVNYYININIIFYLFVSIIIFFIPIKNINKVYTSYKIIFFANVVIIIFLLNANSITKIVSNSDKNFNPHYSLTKNFFSKNHFIKEKINQKKINKFYNDKCLEDKPECLSSQKKLILAFGDTQMHQFIRPLNKLENLNLIYLNVAKQCLLSNQLKHANFLKFYLKIEDPKDCSETFRKMKQILINSEQIKKNKIVLLSSWYNWYFKTQLILNKKNKIVSEEIAYEILLNDLIIFLKNFEKRSDLKFVFVLPPPRFAYSPHACSLNDDKCLIKFSVYKKQIHQLSLIYEDLVNKFNNVEILESGKFFCTEILDHCTMKGNSNLNLIHYRDLENISQNSNINFFKSVKYLD